MLAIPITMLVALTLVALQPPTATVTELVLDVPLTLAALLLMVLHPLLQKTLSVIVLVSVLIHGFAPMEVSAVPTLITLDVKLTLIMMVITKIATWMVLAPTALTMQAAKPPMVVLSLTNLDVILLPMSALVVNLMPTAHLLQVIVMLMDLAEIAPNKDPMELGVLADLSLMDPLVQPPPIETVIL